jgi:archaellum component FlaC
MLQEFGTLVMLRRVIVQQQEILELLTTMEEQMSDLDTAVTDLQSAVNDLQDRLQDAGGDVRANVEENIGTLEEITAQVRGLVSGSGGGDSEPHPDQTLPGDLPGNRSSR